MIIHVRYINIYILIHVKLVFAIFCFPCGLWPISYLIRYRITSNDIQPIVHPHLLILYKVTSKILWTSHWCAILIAHQIVMAKHGGSCVHFSGISTCGRTSRETVSHPQCPPLPTLCKISLPIYVIVTNKLLQLLTTTWYDSLVLSISLFKI